MEPYLQHTPDYFPSPAGRIAELLNARKVGAGRWSAKCPAHADKNPSLSICVGRDGRGLIWCHRGCTLTSILRKLNLSLRDLFVASSLSTADLRALRAQHEQAEERKRHKCHAACWAAREVRIHEKLVEHLGAELARTRDDDPRLSARTRAFHCAVTQFHVMEISLAVLDAAAYGKAL